MNHPRLMMSLFFVIASLFSSAVYSAEGFKWPNLNPFSKKRATATSGEKRGATTIPAAGGMIEDEQPIVAKADRPDKSPKAVPAQPTTLQKWNAGTQAFFSKTTAALNPWGKKKSPPPAPVTGTRKVYNGSSMAPKPTEKKSLFGALLGGGQKEKEPETVDEFIGQPRVPF